MSWFVIEFAKQQGYVIKGAAPDEQPDADRLFSTWLPFGALGESVAAVGHQKAADDFWYVVVKPAGSNSIYAHRVNRSEYRSLGFSPFVDALAAPCAEELGLDTVSPGPLRWVGKPDGRITSGGGAPTLQLAQRLFEALSETDREPDYISIAPERGTARNAAHCRFLFEPGAKLDRVAAAAAVGRPTATDTDPSIRQAVRTATQQGAETSRGLRNLEKSFNSLSEAGAEERVGMDRRIQAVYDRLGNIDERLGKVGQREPMTSPLPDNKPGSVIGAHTFAAAALALIMAIGLAVNQFSVASAVNQLPTSVTVGLLERRVETAERRLDGAITAQSSEAQARQAAIIDLDNKIAALKTSADTLRTFLGPDADVSQSSLALFVDGRLAKAGITDDLHAAERLRVLGDDLTSIQTFLGDTSTGTLHLRLKSIPAADVQADGKPVAKLLEDLAKQISDLKRAACRLSSFRGKPPCPSLQLGEPE
ncbi:hypothetical protein [Bradyrhizobium sp. sGM-13]|uniref:hypothetical protein n=1 Tax=Bradyrhizobium sp. sGM-13 TaxID=2831781 RepID=UPI001BCF2FD9|nr:hypothetical protein [Bradyrhizobium sp. sGM-13]